MPIECALLKDQADPFGKCPKCGEPFVPFMRGQVQSTWRRWLWLPYCAAICSRCKEVAGWEKPRPAPRWKPYNLSSDEQHAIGRALFKSVKVIDSTDEPAQGKE